MTTVWIKGCKMGYDTAIDMLSYLDMTLCRFINITRKKRDISIRDDCFSVKGKKSSRVGNIRRCNYAIIIPVLVRDVDG